MELKKIEKLWTNAIKELLDSKIDKLPLSINF